MTYTKLKKKRVRKGLDPVFWIRWSGHGACICIYMYMNVVVESAMSHLCLKRDFYNTDFKNKQIM